LLGILATGPRVINLYGLPAFFALWTGSAVTGGLFQIYHLKKIESYYVINRCLGASRVIYGLAAVLACTFPGELVDAYPVPIPVPRWLMMLGIVGWDIIAWRENWYPQIGHLAHVGGAVFGALFWAIVLKPLSFTYSSRLRY